MPIFSRLTGFHGRRFRSPLDRYLNALTQSLSRPVDFSARADVDFTRVLKAREEAKRIGCRITIAAIAAKAVSVALSRCPLLMQVPGNRYRYETKEVRLAIPVDSKVSDSYALPITLVDAHRFPLSIISGELKKNVNAIRTGDVGPFAFLLKLPFWAPVWPLAAILAFAAKHFSEINRITFGTPVLTIAPLLRELTVLTSMGGPIVTLGAISPEVSWLENEPIKIFSGRFVCCVDHRVANGRYVANFLEHVRQAVEVDLVEEIQSIVNCAVKATKEPS